MLLDISKLMREPVTTVETIELEDRLEDIGEVVLNMPARGQITLTKLEDLILASFKIQLAVSSECARCLDDALQHIELEFTVEYKLRPGADIAEQGIYHVRKNQIDISEPIRQELISSLPVNVLCRPACKGLCPNCGINWNREKCKCKIEPVIDKIKDRI